ncbi:MAG: ATP-dependent helicase [Bacilli bacterium]
MDLKNLLNDKQYESAVCSSQYTRIVAGAGSGKTRVLTYRIAHLIENENVFPASIMAVTFTNKAAKEIKERVAKLVPCSGIFLGTIHSWCARFLRHEYGYIDYPSNFTILDEDDQKAIMKEILKEEDASLSAQGRHNEITSRKDPIIKECLSWIGGQKTKGNQYKDVADMHYPDPKLRKFLTYWKRYEEICFERKSLDFDDLLLKTIEVLENYEEIKEKYSNRYSHILVDEFQDVNDVQFNLFLLLLNGSNSLYVVGDPDQTIYTWRGANNRIIMKLEDNLRHNIDRNIKVHSIVLNQNYRSTKKILDAANKLIKNNVEREEKDLFSVNEDGEDITFRNCRTVKEEADFVISTIADLHKNLKVEYKDIAILYRANYLTYELERTLGTYRIPYKIFGGMKFYQRKEIKDVVSFFRLIINDADDTAFERVINIPKRGIGDVTYTKIKENAKLAHQTIFMYLRSNLEKSFLKPNQKQSLNKLIVSIDNVREEFEKEQPNYSNILEEFLNNIGYFSYLKDSEVDADDRKDNVITLLQNIDTFMGENEDVDFSDFVANAMLQAAQDDITDGNYVSLMTCHTAKGLEFDYVFVYSLSDGVFPSQRALSESKNAIEEERRLAYVAYTRAKKKLYLTCNNDFSYVSQCNLRPSSFIKEAGIETEKGKVFYNSEYLNSQSYSSSSYNKPKPIAPPYKGASTTNGVSSWKIGDRLEHNKFGKGTVIGTMDKLIIVQFDDSEFGKRSLLGSHISIKKLDKED